MKFRFLIAVLGCVLVPAMIWGQAAEEGDTESVKAPSKPAPQQKSADWPEEVKVILAGTNALRKEHARPELKVDPKLTATAQYFAGYMAKNDKYGHTADGSRPADRATKHGYVFCIILENIAYQYSSTGFQRRELGQKFFEGWKKSPPHRRNMLDPDVADTGVAIARSDETGYYYAVQLFGRPRSMVIEFSIDNQSDATVEYKLGDQAFSLPPRYIRTHQQCRPPVLTFQWPGGKGESSALHPGNGDKLVIAKSEGKFKVSKG